MNKPLAGCGSLHRVPSRRRCSVDDTSSAHDAGRCVLRDRLFAEQGYFLRPGERRRSLVSASCGLGSRPQLRDRIGLDFSKTAQLGALSPAPRVALVPRTRQAAWVVTFHKTGEASSLTKRSDHFAAFRTHSWSERRPPASRYRNHPAARLDLLLLPAASFRVAFVSPFRCARPSVSAGVRGICSALFSSAC